MRLLDNVGALTSDEFDVAVAMGHIPNWEAVRKFGTNSTVGTSGFEDMWEPGTVRSLPAAAAVASVSSSSAADDGDPEGTGAHTLLVSGLDANYLEVSETVTLNGVSAVTTTQTFLRIDRAYITKVGSGGTNAGNISISVGGALQAYITAAEGQTAQAMYTVPANKLFVLTFYNVGIGRIAGSSDCNIEGQIRLWNAERGEYEGWRAISNLYVYNGQEHQNTKSVTVLPPKADMRAQVKSSAATQAHAVFGGHLVKIT